MQDIPAFDTDSATTRRTLSLSHWGAFHAVVSNGRVVAAEPFEKDPAPSHLIRALPAMVHSALRIDRPMVRKGWLERREASDGADRGAEPFVPVDWDVALDLVAGELRRVREAHGAEAIFGGSYGWSSAGRFHHARTQLRRFLFRTGGCVDQVTNYSWGAAQIILPHVVGDFGAVSGRNTSWDAIAEHTDLFVAFGGLNPKNWHVTSGGAAQHVMPGWSRQAAARGVRFVVISPVRDDVPDWLDAEWLPVRPNTDTALMLALAHAILDAGQADRAFLARYTTGFERLEAYITGASDGTPKTPEWAAPITDIPAETIRTLAGRMARGRTFVTSSWSLQRARHGEQPYWMTVALAAILGGIGLPGGGYGFGFGSLNGVGNPTLPIPAPEFGTGPNPADLAIPVARVADMLLQPGATVEFDGRTIRYPDIRLVYWAGGNPFHHHQDLNRFRRAWARPETVIVHDSWWSPAARRADIVLPATTTLERNDIGGSSRDRFVVAMRQAIPPVGGARSDHAILADLAERLGRREAFTEGLDEGAWLRRLYAGLRQRAARLGVETPEFEAFWERGYLEWPAPAASDVLHAGFRTDPDRHPLATPSGRIELYSETIAGFGYADCPPHPTWLPPEEWLGAPQAERFPLHLVSSQPRHRLHSQLDPGPVSAAGKVAGREPVWINPEDAAARGIGDGDVVRLFNDRGQCLAGAVVTDRVRRRVVVLQTGAWYDPADGEGGLEKHGNPNVLTEDRGTSALGQGCSALSCLVEIERFGGEPPPVTAFDRPEIEGGP